MRISYWCSYVCSADLGWDFVVLSVVIACNVFSRKIFYNSIQGVDEYGGYCLAICASIGFSQAAYEKAHIRISVLTDMLPTRLRACCDIFALLMLTAMAIILRSEEHTSELQSLIRISYAVFCLKKKKTNTHTTNHNM